MTINPKAFVHINKYSTEYDNYYLNLLDNIMIIEHKKFDSDLVLYERYDETTKELEYLGCRNNGLSFFPFTKESDCTPFELNTNPKLQRFFCIINPNDYEYLNDLSTYNHNYFKNMKTGQIIIEDCEDDEDIVMYYTYDESSKNKTYLGFRMTGNTFFPFEPEAFPDFNVPFSIDNDPEPF